MIVKVAIPGPFLTPLDYEWYSGELANIETTPNLSLELVSEPDPSPRLIPPVVGGRVWVPFRTKRVVGVVMALAEEGEVLETRMKYVDSVIDAEPIFSEHEMALLQWASHYYHEPIGNVMQTALPKRLRQGESIEVPGISAWALTPDGQTVKLAKNAKQQHALHDFLQQQSEPATAEKLNTYLSQWRQPMKRFVEQGWAQEQTLTCLPHKSFDPKPHHTLNEEQAEAVAQVMAQSGFHPFLLDGVTGSGKTEVYLGMIEAVIAQGKQALVLVPEIGLTPQTVSRFEAYLQAPVAVMHSGLNDKERHCAWHLVQSNQVKVLLGTRSAIFTPFADLGLCIMDEEHDLSFKQQEGFRYSARDCLVRRAQLEQVPVVLGSATPSLETLHNALSHRYGHLRLRQRAGAAQLPSVSLLDVRGAEQSEGVSNALREQMQTHLDAGGQVLLFLNRRGFAPVLMCHACGWQASCPSCDANMTYHQAANELRCHHCGYQTAAPSSCPSCDARDFVKVGQGTERLQGLMETWFEHKRVLRVDRDTTRNKGQMTALTETARKGEADILIGTQMLAKGHHFPKVTLVALIDIDQGLFSADFRAAERMAQLVVQVSGRAGRGAQAGEVVIQTHHPEHPLLKTLVASGYEAFAEQALSGRSLAQLPPFAHQVLLRAESVDAEAGWQFLNEIKNHLNFARMQLAQAHNTPLEVFGPVSAPMMRRQGRYRYQLLLQSEHRGRLHQWLGAVESQLYTSTWRNKVRWSLDVDPQEMS